MDSYEKAISPVRLMKYFDTKEEFVWWLRSGTKEDILATLRAFEDCEMYEECEIINSVLKTY